MSLWSRLFPGPRKRAIAKQLKALEAERKDLVDQITKRRTDGFYNASSGMGVTGRDRSLETFFQPSRLLDLEELDWMYHYNDLFRRVVDKPRTEAMRRGYSIAVLDPPGDEKRRPKVNDEQTQAINTRHKELCAAEYILDGAIWGALKGGAIVEMGIDDGGLASELGKAAPVDENSIRGIRYLDVIQRPQLAIDSWQTDPKLPDYGKPAVYRVNPVGSIGPTQNAQRAVAYKVHASRCIVFGGARTSSQRKIENQGFDLSVLQAPWDVLKANGSIWQMAAMMLEVNGVGVLKVGNLNAMMGNAVGAASLEERAEQINLEISFLKTVLLHPDESYERQAVPLSGLKDVIDEFMSRVSSACDMDDYELWGTMPGGLSITPEHMRARYDRYEAIREHIMQPAIEQLTRIMFLSAEGPTGRKIPDAWEVRFPPLWMPTEAEQATTALAVAQTRSVEIFSKEIRPEEAAVMDHGPESRFPVDLEPRYAALEQKPEAAPVEGEPETNVPTEEVKPEDEEAVDPTTALNGAQVTSLVEVVNLVAKGELPRETGVAIITACFPLSPAQADAVMGPVGKTFTVEPKPVPPPFGGPPTPPPADKEPDAEDEAA